MVIITNLRGGGYNGKQIITRQALQRHFNFEVSSSKLSDIMISEDECDASEDNCMFHKKKLRRGISNYHGINTNNSIKDSIILTPSTNDLHREENSSRRFLKRQRCRTLFNKSEGDCANPLSIFKLPSMRPLPGLHNQNEGIYNEPRSGVFSSSEGKRHCKYKVIFHNKTTTSSEASGNQILNQDAMKMKNDNIRDRKFVDLRYIDGSSETY